MIHKAILGVYWGRVALALPSILRHDMQSLEAIGTHGEYNKNPLFLFNFFSLRLGCFHSTIFFTNSPTHIGSRNLSLFSFLVQPPHLPSIIYAPRVPVLVYNLPREFFRLVSCPICAGCIRCPLFQTSHPYIHTPMHTADWSTWRSE